MEYFLSLLPYLACPVGMGLMMWLMMRGHGGQATGPTQMPAGNATETPLAAGSGDRLAQLRAQFDEVQAQQVAILAQIRRLAAEDRPLEPRDPTSTERIEPASEPTQRPA